jgi:hypothetical protein
MSPEFMQRIERINRLRRQWDTAWRAHSAFFKSANRFDGLPDDALFVVHSQGNPFVPLMDAAYQLAQRLQARISEVYTAHHHALSGRA